MSVFRLFARSRAGSRSSRARLTLEHLERREVLDASQLWAIAGGTYDLNQTFQLHSNPTANHTILLDFDGYTTGNVTGSSWDNLTSPAWDYSGDGPTFSTAEKQIIQRIWARVSEDYAPFNVDVTTQEPANLEDLRKFGTGDTKWGIRVVITPNDAPAPGSGGVAYVGSFNYSDFTPVYVFNPTEKSIAEAASHEVGHSLGLSHDGTATSAYFGGQGSGVTSWGPIMGAAYNPNVTQFSKGEYTGANNHQDDLNIITTQNGFTYKTDDYGNTLATAAPLLAQGASTVPAVYGIIERNTDPDYFSFYSNAGAISLNVDPLTIGPNLAIQADLYNSAGTLLTTVNPTDQIYAHLSYTLPSNGQYFLRVTGTGKGSVTGTGFSNYASLGNYRISGSVQPYASAPDQAPVAVDDSASTTTNTAVTVNVLANDSDPDNDVLTITGVSSVTNGTAQISNGKVIFTPATGFTGTASFAYTISDGRGGTASAVATVTVSAPVNRAPVAVNDNASTVRNTAVTVNVLANDSDPDNDALTITDVSNVTNGTAQIVNNQVVFTPATGFTGTGSFTYTISDGHGGTASAVAFVGVAAPSTTQSFTNNTDVTIVSSRPNTVNSTIVVSGLTGTILDVNVKLNVLHTYDNDLRITLFAPDGTAVVLFNRQGGSSNNLQGTVFDDSAATSITSGAAPFSGTFRPFSLLSLFNGRLPNGTWRLQIEDLASYDGGRLDYWTLTLTTGTAGAAPAGAARATATAIAPATKPVSADDLPDDSGDGRTPAPASSARQDTPAQPAVAAVQNRAAALLEELAEALAQRRRQSSAGDLEADLPRG